MNPTQLSILVNNGTGGVSTVTITIPTGATVTEAVEAISRLGFFFDSSGNAYPWIAVVKVTPQ